MPTAITVSAISTGSDTLTATGHGLLTGDRFRLRPVGGTVPVSTPAIAAVTDLFAIKVDNNTLRVAVSSANALAGTYVDITGAGTATTLYLEYGLPYVVPRVATAGQQVFSADENATWNSLVALHGLLTAQSQSTWSSVVFSVPVTIPDVYHGDIPVTVSASSFVPAGTTDILAPSLGDYWTFGAPPKDIIQAGLVLPVGRRVKSITWHFNKGSSSSSMVMALRKRNGTTNSAIDTLTDTSSGAAFTSSTRSAINYTIATGDAMFMRVQAGNTAHQFSHAIITFDYPAP